MIIKRKYEYLWKLIANDTEAEGIYREACYYGHLEDEGKRVYEYNLQNRAVELELGSGILNPAILWDGLERLDKEKPYNNGFSLTDVNRTEIFDRSFRNKRPWMKLALICFVDGWDHIVTIVNVKE